jgi:4-amino-4-deoxy-L-arabinose transferase-like glycosyltransferase
MVFLLLAIAALFLLYINGLSTNPPGFYVDESGIAYNAYLIAHTGGGEFGQRFPLMFQFYTGVWLQWADPTQIYLLAVPFRLFRPSIWLARTFGASWVFAACLLLGFLAKQITGRRKIGMIVMLSALLTPWLFEVSRLVLDTFFYPMAVVLFLLALYYAQRKESWGWLNAGTIAAGLSLLTYSYTIGRLLGPLMAVGLVFFITSNERMISVARTWVIFGLTLIPLLIFKLRNPEALTQRFYVISYIKPDSPLREIVPAFIRRYLEDLSLVSLLLDGDGNPRHHVPGSLGSFLAGILILAIIGLVIIIVRHWRDPWWRFILFGTLASVVPGSLTTDQFHSLRMVAYPVFLLVLTIPALQFLLERPAKPETVTAVADAKIVRPYAQVSALSPLARKAILSALLLACAFQAMYFQSVFRRDGPQRGYAFDAAYKEVFDAAMALPDRPIYLIDGTSPAYVHAYWYATIEGRNRADFIHLEEGQPPPLGALVIASEPKCNDCQVIKTSGEYIVYRSLFSYQP